MAGVLIMLRRLLRVRDVVETNGFFGEADMINLRNTIVATPDGHTVLVPNKQVFQSPLANFTSPGKRRVRFAVGVSHGEDLDHVRRVTLEAVSRVGKRDPKREVELFYTGLATARQISSYGSGSFLSAGGSSSSHAAPR